jgi:hypothetical protein
VPFASLQTCITALKKPVAPQPTTTCIISW